jgi:hypothetical protein
MSKWFVLAAVLMILPSTFSSWKEHRDAEKRSFEVDRQNRIAGMVFCAIEKYADYPDARTDHEARRAMDMAVDEKLSENRRGLLSNFYRSAKRCHAGGSALDCHGMSANRISATIALLSTDLDNEN